MHARIGGTLNSSKSAAGWSDPTRHSVGDLGAFIECARHKRSKQLHFINKAGRFSAAFNPSVPIVVFSDSVVFKQLMQGVDSNVLFVETTTLFHADRSPNPQNDKYTLQRGNVDTFADLAFLSQASCIVGSDSSFSGLAAAIAPLQAYGRPKCFSLFHHCEDENYDFFTHWFT